MLPQTGSVSLDEVRKELKRTNAISLGEIDVRKLSGVLKGPNSLNDLRGKAYIKIERIKLNFNKMDIRRVDNSVYKNNDIVEKKLSIAISITKNKHLAIEKVFFFTNKKGVVKEFPKCVENVKAAFEVVLSPGEELTLEREISGLRYHTTNARVYAEVDIKIETINPAFASKS